MAKKSVKINANNVRFTLDMDIPTVEEFKIVVYEAARKSATDLESIGRKNGSSGKFYKNWSGKLTKGITAQATNYDNIKFFNNLKYAPYVNWGTGIYASQGNGRTTPWVYYNQNYQKWVTTKGQKPTFFMEKSLDEAEPKIQSNIEKFITEWWND